MEFAEQQALKQLIAPIKAKIISARIGGQYFLNDPALRVLHRPAQGLILLDAVIVQHRNTLAVVGDLVADLLKRSEIALTNSGKDIAV